MDGTQVITREIRRQDSRKVKSKWLATVGLTETQIAEFERKGKPNGCLSRGRPNRRIISTQMVGDRRVEFHATKGPRSYRA